MPSRPTLILAAASMLSLAACEREPQPVDVFVPPTGDAARGKEVFVKYQCYGCHTIPDVDLPQRQTEPALLLALGVRMHRVASYGDLLTAVLYPDHIVSPKFVSALKAAGEDPATAQMPDFTREMTVSELIDVVEFLDEQYARQFGSKYTGKDARPRGRLGDIGGD